MRRTRTLLAMLVAGIAMFRTADAQLPEPVASVEGIHEYRLDNGLRVLLFPDPSKPRVTVNLTVFVGSRHEGYGEAGMAHLLEHMLFKGTPAHPDVPKVLKAHGADFNGTTWLDRTNYYETLPATEENLEFAIALEADRMVNSYVREEDLATEMTVVRNEFERGENSPSRILNQRMFSAAYDWHNYGKATIGNRADIERVPIEKLRRFYKWYYQPDNAMLIIAGQFDPVRAWELVEAHFGKIPRPDRELDTTYTEEPAQDGERIVRLRRVGDVALAGAMYHIPAGSHPDYVPLDLLEHILTASPSGRLYQALVMTKRASNLSGAAYALHDPGVLRVIAEVAPGNNPEDVLATMLEIMETIGEEGVTQEELERAQRYWMKTWEMAFNDTAQLAVQLSDWASQGDWRLMFLYRDRLEAATVEDVNRATREYLTRNNRTAGLFLPTDEPQRVTIPPTGDIAAIVGDYQGRETMALGEAFDVSAENIQNRTIYGELGSDDFKFAMLPKRTRGQTVHVRLKLHYGTPETLKGLTVAAEVLPSLMLKGTRELDRQQIQDRLDEMKSRLTATGNTGDMTLNLETRREYLPQALDLLRQVLREPTLPDDELEILRNRNISRLKQQSNDPTNRARVAVSRYTSPYDKDDVRYVPTIEEEIERWENLTRADVARLYSEYLSAEHGELSVVGDFDPDEVRSMAQTIFADWTTAAPYERISRDGDVIVPNAYDEIDTPDKDQATYLAATVLPIRDNHPDYPALLMANYILGSSGLSSRLGDRVRQNEGLSYSVGSFLTASSLDDRAILMFYAIMNPGNSHKVVTAIREELERLHAAGVTQDELDAARDGYLQNQLVERADDSQLAVTLGKNLEADRTMDYYIELESKLAALTPEDVRQAVQKYVHLDRIAVVVAGDLKAVHAGVADEPAATPVKTSEGSGQ